MEVIEVVRCGKGTPWSRKEDTSPTVKAETPQPAAVELQVEVLEAKAVLPQTSSSDYGRASVYSEPASCSRATVGHDPYQASTLIPHHICSPLLLT